MPFDPGQGSSGVDVERPRRLRRRRARRLERHRTAHRIPWFSTGLRRGTDDPEAELADQERILPPLAEGEVVPVTGAEAKGHDTQPPDRYSEATLIKKLEDLGIGRPSTYASVMKTIDRRGYVWKKGKSLVPAFRAFAVVNLLQHYFADLVDYQFTAAMEDELDEIAKGIRTWSRGCRSSTSAILRRRLNWPNSVWNT